VLAGIDVVGRWLIPIDQLERGARLRAESAFLEEEVFNTRDRTGILVFLALFEHQAVILADEGVHRTVPKDEWLHLVDDLVAGIKAGRAREALCEALTRCGEVLVRYEVELRPDDEGGEVLVRYEVELRPDDEDELSDAPRIRER